MNNRINLSNVYIYPILVTMFFLLVSNFCFAQHAHKILKDDGSVTYINSSEITNITFEMPLAIGDTHEGGLIFYLDASGEHGLIAAPSDQSTSITWYNGSATLTSAYGNSAGAGEMNTFMVCGSQGTGSYAAQLCNDLSLNGYDDWYLPSKFETNLMYTNLKLNTIGDFADDYYWTSNESESSSNICIVQNFSNGTQADDYKSSSRRVRAVRAF